MKKILNSLRVFLLGPSHHVYMKGVGLSSLKAYQTPLGDIQLDLDSFLFYLLCTDFNYF